MIETKIETRYGTVQLLSIGKERLSDDFTNCETPEDWILWTRREIAKNWDTPLESVHCLDQIHSNRIFLLDEQDNPVPGKQGDGLICESITQVLVIRTADCVPLLAWDYETKRIAAVHIGWKGAREGILESFWDAIHKNGWNSPGFYIGPYIRGKDYEVGEDVYSFFQGSNHIQPKEGTPKKYLLDLGEWIQEEILRQYPDAFIMDSGENTFGSSEWFSHRSGEKGRNLNAIRFLALSRG